MCPSDYMIERMINEDLLLPIDFDMVENAVDYTSPYILELFDEFTDLGPNNNKKLADYAVGYTWGTMGIVYNPALIKLLTGFNDTQVATLVSSWNALWGQMPDGSNVAALRPSANNKKSITFKDSIRDNYFTAHAYVNDGDSSTNNQSPDDALLNDIKTALQDQKSISRYWEVDRMRQEIYTKKNITLGLQWAGDAKYSVDEAAERGVELKYAVPEKGSNVFFDAWVIPKYAKQNGDLAEKFLNFISDPEVAFENMEWVGYTSTIMGDLDSVVDGVYLRDFFEDETAYTQQVDMSYFFFGSAAAGTKQVMMNVCQIYYPEYEVLKKCHLMKDFSEADRTRVNTMWRGI